MSTNKVVLRTGSGKQWQVLIQIATIYYCHLLVARGVAALKRVLCAKMKANAVGGD